jgi:hypothetical protein
MNCQEFLDMDDFDRAMYMASLIHCCQSNSDLFKSGAELIALGKRKGLFDNIKLFPDHNHDKKETV